MALFGRIVGTTLLVGAGALTIATIVAAPTILRASRPIAREALRRGLDLYGRVRAAAAEFADDVEDLVAEVRAETTADPPANDASTGAAKRA
jgi:hypothetical protein